MEFLSVLVFWLLLLLASVFYFKLKKPELLSNLKPKLKFFPKYQLKVTVLQSILDEPDRLQQLATHLESLGFKEVKRTDTQVVYSRGKLIGDFSVQHMKVDLIFSRPLQTSTNLEVSYGAFALFDTGALWLLCNQLLKHLETAV